MSTDPLAEILTQALSPRFDAWRQAVEANAVSWPRMLEAARMYKGTLSSHLPIYSAVFDALQGCGPVEADQEFADALRQDSALGAVAEQFDQAMTDHPEDGSQFGVWCGGAGDAWSPERSALLIIYAALQRQVILGLPLSLSQVTELVQEGLADFRIAAQAGTVDADELIGFGGVEVPEAVHTPWGKLVRAPGAQRPVLPFWEQTSAIHCSRRSVPVRFVDFFDDPSVAQQIEDGTDTIAQLLPLAVVFAQRPEAIPVAPRRTWVARLLSFAPFAATHGYSTLTTGRAGFVALTETTTERFRRWASIINEAHDPKVNTAVRRILSALSNRESADDRLIDAVIAWEVLFGDREELTFKVSGSIAKLLTDDLAVRREKFGRLIQIYRTRSALVHGSKVGESKVAMRANEAIEVALDVMMNLYESRPSWLGYAPKERVEALLLDLDG